MVYTADMPPGPKARINFALTLEARDLLRRIADEQGLSMNAALEVLIRSESRRRTTPGRPAAAKQARAGEATEAEGEEK